jgi:hypothetical protein
LATTKKYSGSDTATHFQVELPNLTRPLCVIFRVFRCTTCLRSTRSTSSLRKKTQSCSRSRLLAQNGTRMAPTRRSGVYVWANQDRKQAKLYPKRSRNFQSVSFRLCCIGHFSAFSLLTVKKPPVAFFPANISPPLLFPYLLRCWYNFTKSLPPLSRPKKMVIPQWRPKLARCSSSTAVGYRTQRVWGHHHPQLTTKARIVSPHSVATGGATLAICALGFRCVLGSIT